MKSSTEIFELLDDTELDIVVEAFPDYQKEILALLGNIESKPLADEVENG